MRLFLVSIVLFCNGLSALEIDVFYADPMVIQNPQVKGKHQVNFWNLSKIAHFEKELNKGIPKDKEKAERWAENLELRWGKDKLAEMSKEAYIPLMQAMKHGVKELPAVVINNKYVIFGELDINRAVSLYNEWERQQ